MKLDNKTNKDKKTVQWFIEKKNQYLVWPPSASTTARHLLLMEPMRCLHTSRGIASHSSWSACLNCWSEVGWWGRSRTLLSSSSHRCSMGFRSGDFDGQGNTAIPIFIRWAVVMRAACGLALSCMYTICGLRTKRGTTSGLITWSIYIAAVIFPSIKTRSDFSCMSIHPQTITLPPLCLSCSLMQLSLNLSPRLLHTLIRPSPACRQYRDSSLNTMLPHSWRFHLLWARAHVSRARRWWGLNTTRTAGRYALSPPAIRRFRTVWAEIRRSPGIAAAVRVAGLNLSLERKRKAIINKKIKIRIVN